MVQINNNRELTHERLLQLIHYEPETGLFTRRTTAGRIVRGSPAGGIRRDGYRIIVLDYVAYKAARIAWFYVHGQWPEKCIDHINRIKSDDRLCNLRQATWADNSANISLTPRNSTGVKGVSRTRNGLSYAAKITRNGKIFRLGTYKTIEAAAAARKSAALQLHADFASEAL